MNACPHCGAPSGPGREYCLDCGRPLLPPTRVQAARARLAESPIWSVLALLVLAAAGAFVAVAASRGGGTSTIVATNLPERTTVPHVPVIGTAVGVPTIPLIVTTAPPTTTAPTASTLTPWTLADGYTLVLASVPQSNGRATAVQIAKRALAQGLPAVGVLDTKDFSGLSPGFFVVFSGVYATNADAAAHLAQAKTAGFASPYARHITR